MDLNRLRCEIVEPLELAKEYVKTYSALLKLAKEANSPEEHDKFVASLNEIERAWQRQMDLHKNAYEKAKREADGSR